MWQTHTDTYLSIIGYFIFLLGFSCLYTQKKFLLFIYRFYHRSPFVFFLFLLRHVTCIPFIFPCMPLDRHLLAAVSAVSVCHPVPPNKRRTCLLGYMDGRKRRCSIPGIIMIPFFFFFPYFCFFKFFCDFVDVWFIAGCRVCGFVFLCSNPALPVG